MNDRLKRMFRCGFMLGIMVLAVLLTACHTHGPRTGIARPPLPQHGPGQVDRSACNKSQGHGGSYKPVACPEACNSTVTDHTFQVDDYIDNPIRENDPDICLHSATDTLTYVTAGKNGRVIQIMRYENNQVEGHPFLDSEAPPFPNGGPATNVKAGHLDPGRRPPAGKCFQFEAYILVKENGKTDRCFDPHIYTE